MMTTLNNRVSALFADPLQTLFSELQSPTFRQGNGHSPRSIAPLSIWDEADSVCVEMDVPGLTQEDLEIALHKRCLTIKGQRKAPSPSTDFRYQERQFGGFERSVMLGEWVDPSRVDADLRDGVLHLKLAKKAEAQPQKISIKTGTDENTNRLGESAD
jgi:HSP20 family protein